MMQRLCSVGLLGILLLVPVGVMTGCQSSSEPVKPEQFAPPPTEGDEKSEEAAG
jgi:hypothetical protein